MKIEYFLKKKMNIINNNNSNDLNSTILEETRKNNKWRCARELNHTGRVNFVKFNAEGGYCLSGSTDKNIKLWNPHTGSLIKTYTGHGWEVLNLAVSPDNSRFCSCGGDKQVMVWDVATGKIIRRYTGHSQKVNDVSYNAEATVIASGSDDTSVRLWDTRSLNRQPIQILDEAKDSITSVQFYESFILTGSVDGSIRVYDVRKGNLTTDVVGHSITCSSFSSDANCIRVSTLDSTIQLFDRENGQLLSSYTGHINKNYKVGCCLSNTDSHVIGGSEDGRIFIWDLVESNITSSFIAHSKAVLSVNYHPTQDMILSSSSDGTIKVWEQK